MLKNPLLVKTLDYKNLRDLNIELYEEQIAIRHYFLELFHLLHNACPF